MRIRKGPYGRFVSEILDKDTAIFTYADEIIGNGVISNLLPINIEQYERKTEISFEFSELVSISECPPPSADNTETINSIRNALSGLFLAMIRMNDILLPLSNLVWDNRYIFTDNKYEMIYVCYKPVKEEETLPSLDSTNIKGIEQFLSLKFFDNVLREDEKSALLYAVKENNEQILSDLCNDLALNKKIKASTRADRKLLVPLVSAFASLILLKSVGIIFSIPFFFYSAYKLYKTIKGNKSFDASETSTQIDVSKRERKNVLFADNEYEVYSDEKDSNLFYYAALENINPNVKEKSKIGIYSDEVTIGSDRFLCDIFIEDDNLSPIQAKIERIDNSYWITDLSEKQNTYIENRSIKSKEKYEIKNNQLIGFGKSNYIFKIGF